MADILSRILAARKVLVNQRAADMHRRKLANITRGNRRTTGEGLAAHYDHASADDGTMEQKTMSKRTEAVVKTAKHKTIRACAGFADDGYGGVQLIWRDVPLRYAHAQATKPKGKR